MQSLAQFLMTSKFYGESLWSGWRYLKLENWLTAIPSTFSRKTFGELWPTNYKVCDVSLDPPKSTFLKDHILAPIGGVVTWNFYIR